MAIHCYVTPQGSVDEALVAASEVEELLWQGFSLGAGGGRPLRVPLYDYLRVPVERPAEARENPRDFMRVEAFGTTQVPDPDDPRQIRVVADIRCSWRRTARLPSGTQIVESVRATADEASA